MDIYKVAVELTLSFIQDGHPIRDFESYYMLRPLIEFHVLSGLGRIYIGKCRER